MTINLSVIMCAYNEMGLIQPALDDLIESADGRSEEFEVIFVDKGSTDGTREWLSSLDLPYVKIILNENNLGKGGSIKKGIALSSGQYVIIHDPDMEYRAADVWRMLDCAREERADMVLGSRTLGGRVSYTYVANFVGVRFLTTLINMLHGGRITDSATALKLMNGDMARNLRLKSSGFDLDFELVVRVLRLGRRISERRVEYFPRTKAQGKKLVAWRDGLMALRVIVRDRFIPKSRFTLSESESVGLLRSDTDR